MSFLRKQESKGKMEHNYYVYILASKKNGTLYLGITRNLVRRVYQHKRKEIQGFSKKYGVDKLIYFESTQDVIGALERKKQLKRWKRQWKIDLIEKYNPEWRDLYDVIADEMDSCFRRNDNALQNPQRNLFL